MPAFELEKARKFVREYLSTLDDISNATIKDVRKYLEKKFGLPRKGLAGNKNEIKQLLKEEATKVIETKATEEKEEKEKTEVKEKPKKAEKAEKKEAEKKEEEKKADNEATESDEDPEPKKYSTSYMLFAQEHRQEVRDAHPEMKLTELTKELGKMWKKLSKEEQDKYKQQSDKDKQQYEKEMAAWRERHPDTMTRREMSVARKRAKEGIASPVKGKSAYQLFCKDHPELDSLKDRKERSKKLRELWKELDTEKKAEYVEKEKEELEKYNEEKRELEKKKEERKEKAAKKAERQKIPHAKSAYMLFAQENRERVKKAHPDAKPTEMMKLLGEEWKKVDEKTSKKYQKMAEEEKKRAEEKKKELIESGELKDAAKEKKQKRVSAYNVFVTAFSADFKKSHPDATFKERSGAAASAWREMSDKKKEKYQKMADEHNKNVPEVAKPKKADPITAEGVFTKEFREKVLSEKPDCDARTLKQAARKAWRQLEVEKKIEYEDKAHEQNVARLREQL